MLLLFAGCSTAGGHYGREHWCNSGLYGDEYGFALHLSPHRLLCSWPLSGFRLVLQLKPCLPQEVEMAALLMKLFTAADTTGM